MSLEESLINGMLEMKEQIGEMSAIVKRHDEDTFPRMEKRFDRIEEAALRIESKQNKDILHYNEKSEELEGRISALERESEELQLKKKEAKKEVRKVIWGAISAVAISFAIATYQRIIVFFKLLLAFLIK